MSLCIHIQCTFVRLRLVHIHALTVHTLYVHAFMLTSHSLTDACRKQVVRFCGHMVPVYAAATLLLACGGQLSSILQAGRTVDMSQVTSSGLRPLRVNGPVFLLHLVLR